MILRVVGFGSLVPVANPRSGVFPSAAVCFFYCGTMLSSVFLGRMEPKVYSGAM